MKVLINGDKAKWVDGNENGRWQKIKSDDKGHFIRKGTDVVYIDEYINKNDNRHPIEVKAKDTPDLIELDSHELKIYHAYWESKHFWDKMFDDVSDRDFYYYRGLCVGMPKSFFLQKIKNNK